MIIKPQTKWRWIIAGYLFLAGLGGGAYITGVVADYLGGAWAPLAKVGAWLGFPCVALGCGLLILDLGKPQNFWRAYMRPNCSWMARGTIIITCFMILGAIHIAFWLWPFAGVLGDGGRHFIGVLGSVFAFCTMIYTGILLGAARPIAFWSTATLPVLFLVSAASTGVMAVIFVGQLAAGAVVEGPIATLAKIDLVLVVLEIFILGLHFQATHRVPEARESARIVLKGEVAPLFWVGVAVLGLGVPLILELVGALAGHGAAWLGVLASICGIAGGLLLRQVILHGGVHAPLKAGRFEYGLPIV